MRKRFHGLKRPKVRADWSKWTLYNLYRTSYERNPISPSATFFQQKWKSKAMTRAYHGEQIREGLWSRMFDRRLPSVIAMSPRVLATTDGSEMSAGRGSGADMGLDPRATKSPPQTPYMHMTYWPTERRLDTAIWRALFASSVRQARQFVVHGSVTVNGKKMQTPGYLLNPGDLFSVDPERVMYATGARKFSKDSPESMQGEQLRSRRGLEAEDEASASTDKNEPSEEKKESEDEGSAESTATDFTRDIDGAENPEGATETAEVPPDTSVKTLRGLLGKAKGILGDGDDLSGKRKNELRELTRAIKQTLARFKGSELKPSKKDEDQPIEDTIVSFQESLAAVINKIPDLKLKGSEDVDTTETDAFETEATPPEDETSLLHVDAKALQQAIISAQANPIDPSKPYATPWRPREFMGAFAFIPRYLEVHHKICSAVYLRHPVARPGLAEVPSPFPSDIMQLAHNWYLRRR